MPTSSKLDENWTKTTDAAERRRIQNRLAQRNYRMSHSPLMFILSLVIVENDEDDVLLQQQNVSTYPASQPVSNEISVSGHAEIQMDSLTTQIEPNQYIFGLNPAQNNRAPSPQSQHQQYTSFGHATLTYDRQSSGPTTPTHPQLQYRTRHASASTRPPAPDSATQSAFSVGSVPPKFTRIRIPTLSPNPGNSASGTPLHQAATNGHLHIVRFLLLKGANLTAPNEAGQTVLHLAAERGHEAVVEHVLSEDISQFTADGQMGGGGTKAFIDRVDDQGFTALHRAAASGHEECVRILVEAGAEIESSGRSSVPSSGASSGSKDDSF
ncbi:putative serine/threonine-protein kinase ripk4 [Halenospora varia]|nr:putative serine/threonine-protein kinase ripk4 [Halenospora varia]